MDCVDRPLEWFLSKQGEFCFNEALKNTDAMNKDFNSNGNFLNNLGVYNYNGYITKPLYPCKFVHSVFKYYWYKTKNFNYNDNLVYIVTCHSNPDYIKANGGYDLTYPKFIKLETNPILYFCVKQANIMTSYYEKYGFADRFTIFAKRIEDYIIACLRKGIDASKEQWIYDENLYTENNIYKGRVLKSYKAIEDFIEKNVAHKELLSDVHNYPSIYCEFE